MSGNERTRIGCAGLNSGDGCFDTLKEQMPEMTHLFELLDAGITPNFLDMMKGISEMVAFYTDSDQIPDDIDNLVKVMSQNKCRFCS